MVRARPLGSVCVCSGSFWAALLTPMVLCVAAASQREHAALSSKNGATPPAESRPLTNAVWSRTVVIITTRVGTAAALTDRIATLEAALQQEQRALAALNADHEAAVEKHREELAAAGDAQREAVEGKPARSLL